MLENGTQTCYKDLLVVKSVLKEGHHKVRRGLRTFKLWAPFFGGHLPRLNEAKSRSVS